MADENLLYLTELLGLRVFDLKGRRIGVVKDAAIVPLIEPTRIDRFLIGTGSTWLTWLIRRTKCIISVASAGGES
jgi:sporulation protein YlmC with PRC-barrel domain